MALINNKDYILKEISSEPELELFLRFRYNGFCNSPAGYVLTKNKSAIDINYYDRKSRHYAIYTELNRKAVPVGYFRIVLEEPTMADEWVSNISQRVGLTHITEQPLRHTFPFSGIYPDTGLEKGFYTRKASFEKAGEVSRFIISESERSVRLSLQIIKSAFAIALLHIQHAFVLCLNDHSKAYMKFGFRQCPGSSTFTNNSIASRNECILLYCGTGHVTNELKTRFKIMQQQFLKNRCLALNL